MRPRPPLFAFRPAWWNLPVLALVLLATAHARRNDAIAISATARREYVRPLDPAGRPLPETYVFMEGEHMGGSTADSSEAKVTFTDITRVLAANLLKQNYLPTRDVGSAKLLIRVFWGTTLTYEDPQKLQDTDRLNAAVTAFRITAQENGIADPGEINLLMQDAAGDQSNTEQIIARNAALLGYTRSLNKLTSRVTPGVEEQTMRADLSEERYFVVLLAYDYEQLRRKKGSPLLWITRLSIRSSGNNFTEALPLLALAGAQSYGRNEEEMQRVKVRALPGGDVKMPEVQVLGTVSVGGK